MKKTMSLVLVLALSLVTDVAKADFVFGEPVNLGSVVNSSSLDGTPIFRLTAWRCISHLHGRVGMEIMIFGWSVVLPQAKSGSIRPILELTLTGRQKSVSHASHLMA